jgi:hypothetical protein
VLDLVVRMLMLSYSDADSLTVAQAVIGLG